MPLNIPSRSYGMADSDTSGDIERRLRELETFVFQDLRRLLLERKGVLRVSGDGSIQIGPTSGYVNISKTDGTLTLLGAARTWMDIQPYATANGQGPAALSLAQYGTTGYYLYKWADNHSADEKYQFGFQMPHQMVTGSDAHFHLHIIPSANGTAGNQDVVFKIDYQWVNVGDSFSTTTNSTATKTFTVGTSEANKQLIWSFTGLSGAGKTLSSALLISVSRLSKTSASDNYTGDIHLLFGDVHTQVDGFGSNDELVK